MSAQSISALSQRLQRMGDPLLIRGAALREAIHALRTQVADTARLLQAYYTEQQKLAAESTGRFVSRNFRVYERQSGTVTLEWVTVFWTGGKLRWTSVRGKSAKSPKYPIRDLLSGQPEEIHAVVIEVEERARELREILTTLAQYDKSAPVIRNRINRIASPAAVDTPDQFTTDILTAAASADHVRHVMTNEAQGALPPSPSAPDSEADRAAVPPESRL